MNERCRRGRGGGGERLFALNTHQRRVYGVPDAHDTLYSLQAINRRTVVIS